MVLLLLLALLLKGSSTNPREGEGERDIDGRGEYCVEFADASKPLGSVYDRAGENLAGFVEFTRRKLGLLDVIADSETGWEGARANEDTRRNR